MIFWKFEAMFDEIVEYFEMFNITMVGHEGSMRDCERASTSDGC